MPALTYNPSERIARSWRQRVKRDGENSSTRLCRDYADETLIAVRQSMDSEEVSLWRVDPFERI